MRWSVLAASRWGAGVTDRSVRFFGPSLFAWVPAETIVPALTDPPSAPGAHAAAFGASSPWVLLVL
jgi:hypothetical protein